MKFRAENPSLHMMDQLSPLLPACCPDRFRRLMALCLSAERVQRPKMPDVHAELLKICQVSTASKSFGSMCGAV